MVASTWLGEPMSDAIVSRSSASCSARGRVPERLRRRLPWRSASGLLPTSSRASSIAAAWGSSATRVARPRRTASSPLTMRPVKVSSLATSSPTSRTSVWVPVMSGIRPQRDSRTESLASGATTRMSAPSAICSPPPSAGPWTAAMTGTSSSCHTQAACWPRWVIRPSVSPIAPSGAPPPRASLDAAPPPPAIACKLLKSSPAQKPRPAPESTTTRTARSALSASPASTMARKRPVSRAFSLSGRLRRRSATPSTTSSRIRSDIAPACPRVPRRPRTGQNPPCPGRGLQGPTTRMRTRHRRHHGARRLAVLVAAALAASGTVAVPAPSAAAARPGTGSAVPAALPLAPPSPDLAGLPEVSIELAAVPVTGTAVERALDAYQSADAHLAAAQQRRTAIDRAIAGLGARRSRLEAALAGAEASAASAAARLDEVSAAIADLAVQRYLGGGSAARLDAALADEHPSINDQDQRAVLGDAALDVLLTERAAYQERLDAALHRVEAARAELAEVDATAGGLVGQRPAALEGELAASPTVTERRVDYEHARVLGTVAGVDFQLVALDAYHRAAAAMAEEAPACGLQWWALAGISRIEGRHGTYGGAALDARGD